MEVKKSHIFSILGAQITSFWTPVFFGLGVGVYFSLNFEPNLLISLIQCISLLLIYIFISNEALKKVFYFLLLISLGFFLTQGRVNLKASPKIFNETRAVIIHGMLEKVELRANNSKRIVIKVNSVEGFEEGEHPEKIRLTVRTKMEELRAGDIISTRAVLMPNPQPIYPGDYNFPREAWFLNIGAVGYSIAPVIKTDENLNINNSEKIEHIRKLVASKVNNHLSGQTAAVGQALLTGLRGQISEETNENMRRSGLAHLLAISGLHMALITGVLFSIIRASLAAFPTIALKYSIKKVSAALSWFGALSYLIISGGSVSTERAFIMVSIMLLAIILDRKAISMRLVGIAALVILVIQPEAILGAGFQMSFAAVIGLVASYQAFGAKLQKLNSRNNSIIKKLGIYLIGISVSTIIAEVSIFPIAAYHFHNFSTYGLLGNLFAVPLMGFIIMPFGLLTFLLIPFGIEVIALIPFGYGIDLMLMIANWVSNLPGASAAIINMPQPAFLFFIFSGLFLTLGKGKFFKSLSGVSLFCALALFTVNQKPDLIIDREGGLISVKGSEDIYFFNNRRSGRFARESWLERFGQTESPNWLDMAENPKNPKLFCDTEGCVIEMNNEDSPKRLVSFPNKNSAFWDDCGKVNLIISSIRSPKGCDFETLVIDKTDFQENGAHLVFFNREIEISSVGQRNGLRPWTNPNYLK